MPFEAKADQQIQVQAADAGSKLAAEFGGGAMQIGVGSVISDAIREHIKEKAEQFMNDGVLPHCIVGGGVIEFDPHTMKPTRPADPRLLGEGDK